MFPVPPPSISIVPATPADVPLVLALVQELAEYEKCPDQVVATLDSLRDSLFGAKPECECVIGSIDGTPLGFALFFHNFSTWVGRKGLYLEDLFVRPAARGKGLGKALFDHVEALALARGCTRMEWSVLDWNKPAIDFYLTLGAKPMTGWTVYRLRPGAQSGL